MNFKSMLAIDQSQWILIALLAVMVIVLIVLPMFTNRRRNKAVNDLYNSIRPGDVIKTVGGIIGTVIEVKEITPVDKQMIIETGVEGSKTTMVFDLSAVYQIVSKVAAPDAPATEEVAPQTAETVPTATETTTESVAASEPAEVKEEVVRAATVEEKADAPVEETPAPETAATADVEETAAETTETVKPQPKKTATKNSKTAGAAKTGSAAKTSTAKKSTTSKK